MARQAACLCRHSFEVMHVSRSCAIPCVMQCHVISSCAMAMCVMAMLVMCVMLMLVMCVMLMHPVH